MPNLPFNSDQIVYPIYDFLVCIAENKVYDADQTVA